MRTWKEFLEARLVPMGDQPEEIKQKYPLTPVPQITMRRDDKASQFPANIEKGIPASPEEKESGQNYLKDLPVLAMRAKDWMRRKKLGLI